MTPSKTIETFLAFLRETEQAYRMAEADEQDANDESQDILHSLELKEHTYHEYAQMSKRLKQVRMDRRVAKDLQITTAPVVDWIHENPAVIKRLERLLGDVRKAEKSTQNRIYIPKKKERPA